MARLLAAVVLVAALVAAVPALAGKRVDSGIRGEATQGPTCPVEREPPDPQCADRPYQATVRIRRRRTGEVVKTFTTHRDGTFKVHLRPGRYRLEPTNRGLPHGDPQDVTVEPHEFTRVHLEYDTGIR